MKAMSRSTPIYNDPLAWWQEHLAELERTMQYMEDTGIKLTPADRAMLETARAYVTRYVIEKLESDNET